MGKESLLNESDFYLRIASGLFSKHVGRRNNFCLVSKKQYPLFILFFLMAMAGCAWLPSQIGFFTGMKPMASGNGNG